MKFFKRLSIEVQLYTIALTTVAVIFFVVLFTYSKFFEVVQLNNAKSYESLINQIRQTQQGELDIVSRLITNVAFNSTVQTFVSEKDPLRRFEVYQQLKSYLSNTTMLSNGISDIMIISNEGTKFNISGYMNAEMQQGINQLVTQTTRKRVFFSDLLEYEGSASFLAASDIYQTRNENDFGERIGKVIFVLKAQSFSGDLTNSIYPSDPKIYMLDSNLKLFASNQTNQPGALFDLISSELLNSKDRNIQVKVAHEKYTMNVIEISPISGYLVSLVSQKKLARDLSNIRWLELLIFVSAILFLSIPFSLIIRNILTSLKKLLQFMNRLKSGDLTRLKQHISLDGFAEIRVVANTFNSMLTELDQLTEELLESNTNALKFELEKKNAQYDALKSQINPHFLYNTLESIRGLAVEYEANDIRAIAKSLGLILRYSIKGQDEVCLKDELQIIEAYIAIQTYRFHNRFHFHFEIEPKAMDIRIPKMIMQPLVENAVFHGLEPKRGKGNLRVIAYIRGNELVIGIEDDGMGIPPETLERIQSRLSDDCIKYESVSGIGESIGILNVHRRIHLKYGNQYGLSVESSPLWGTKITVTLPLGG